MFYHGSKRDVAVTGGFLHTHVQPHSSEDLQSPYLKQNFKSHEFIFVIRLNIYVKCFKYRLKYDSKVVLSVTVTFDHQNQPVHPKSLWFSSNVN